MIMMMARLFSHRFVRFNTLQAVLPSMMLSLARAQHPVLSIAILSRACSR